MTTEARRSVGGCRLIGPIGAGASSTVYRAIDDGEREVAVKVLAENHSLLPDMRQRFLDEVDLLSAIDSPDITRVHRAGATDDGRLYMVLELADRGDLQQRVDELRADGTQVGAADVLVLGRHLERALSALHAAGIVHRDVTPGNILIGRSPDAGLNRGVTILNPGERLVLADLGLAKDLEFASGITAGGGTRGFAAPEQQADVSVIDHRADVYGATALVQWLLGDVDQPPFAAVPSFLTTGMAADPSARFASMADWLDGLEAIFDTPMASAATRRSGPAIAAVVGAVTLGVALLGFGASELVNDDALPEGGSPTTVDDGLTDTDVTNTDDSDDREAGADGTQDGTSADDASASGASSNEAPDESGEGVEDGVSPSTAPADESTITSVEGATTIPAPPPTGSTTTDPKVAASPRAYIVEPEPDATVSGDLEIAGTARYVDGIAYVELTIKNEDTNQFWNPTMGAFQSTWLRFEVPVSSAGGSDFTWTYAIPAEALDPGQHRLRVWGRASTGNGDPVSNVVYLNVTP